jgi:hypothetical protein
MGIIPGTGGIKTATAEYDFARHGGAVGTVEFGESVDKGAIVLGGNIEVVTALASAGAATAALQIQAAGDLVAQAAVAGAPWSSTGLKSVVPAFTGATAVKLTAARRVALVIGTAALTAGRLRVVLLYV